MSYIRTYLPDIEVLKEQLRVNPGDIEYYRKYDTLIGSEESIKLIKNFRK